MSLDTILFDLHAGLRRRAARRRRMQASAAVALAACSVAAFGTAAMQRATVPAVDVRGSTPDGASVLTGCRGGCALASSPFRSPR